MPKRGRAFGEKEDYEHLSVDGDGLYWNGKKIKTGGMTNAEKIALIALITTAVLTTVVNLDKIEARLCDVYSFSYCPPAAPPSNSQPAPSAKSG